jgi:hypothetical protein
MSLAKPATVKAVAMTAPGKMEIRKRPDIDLPNLSTYRRVVFKPSSKEN